MIDVSTNQILSLEITEEDVPDDDMFLPLLNQAEVMCGEGRIEKALGDGLMIEKNYSMNLKSEEFYLELK